MDNMNSEEVQKLSDELYIKLEEELKNAREFPSGPTFKYMSKHLAEQCMKRGRVLDGIYHQTESLGVSLRLMSKYTSKSRSAATKTTRNLDPIYLNFKGNYEGTEGMMKRLHELPEEWTVVQITLSFMAKETFIRPGQRSKNLTLWVSVLPTGSSSEVPVVQRVPFLGQREDSMLTPLEELARILTDNKNKPKEFYNNKQKYWEVRQAINDDIESLVKDIESSWLGKWRFLLLGNFTNKSIRTKISKEMDKLLLKHCTSPVSDRTRFLLYRIAAACFLLQVDEVHSLVGELLGSSKEAKVIAREMMKMFLCFDSATRQPVILIADELLDMVPWENLQILADQPMTRVTCLPMLHALYKVHEESIQDGYMMVDNATGYYVVNPQKNLNDMEQRLRQFITKRLPSWEGNYGKCTLEEFLAGLDKFNVFLYSGHGDGRDLLPKSRLENADVKSVSLLMGCKSIYMASVGGCTEYTSIAHSYHKAACPLVIGNLWEVSDVDTDRLTVAILHSWVPLDPSMSKDIAEYMSAPLSKHWHYSPQPDLLRSMHAARKSAKNMMTRYAIVARGLPVMAVKT